MKEYTEQELKENSLRNEGYVMGLAAGRKEIVQEIMMKYNDNPYDNIQDCENKTDKGECILNDLINYVKELSDADI